MLTVKTASAAASVTEGRRGAQQLWITSTSRIGRQRAPHGAVDRDDGVVRAAAQIRQEPPRQRARLHAALAGRAT